MRILQIVPSISLVYGGPSQMVLGLSSALANHGVDVTILTTNTNGDVGQPPLDVPLDRPVEQNGYQIRYFRCFPFRRYKFSFDLLYWLYIHGQEFDLAHFHALFSPVISGAVMVARRQSLPYILRPLGTLDPADLQKKYLLKQIYTMLIEGGNLAGATAIHFTSKEEAKVAETFGIVTKNLIIPLGVNFSKVAIANGSKNIYSVPSLLFLSRIDPKKGLDLLLPALENLLREGIDFRFVLAGSNPQNPGYEAQVRSQISASPLAKCTTITGFVTGDDKVALFQEADLFVLPSYYENFGIAVAEAMVAGIPVAISDRVYIWEDVQQSDSGWVYPLKVDALTDTLRLALQDAKERKRRGLNAQRYALKNYSWDAIAQQMIQVYQQILTNKD